tara:strand:- start:64 stop:528 length:465 start_codon:yes stop_codon:yes gene_type:complete
MKNLLVSIVISLSFFNYTFADGHGNKECSGSWTNVAKNTDIIDLGDGVTLTIWSTRGTTASDNSLLSGAGGCGGYIINMPNGYSKTGYACARKNADGIWTDFGGWEPGEKKGVFNMIGGTGKFANLEGTGTWSPITMHGDTTLGEWSGKCSASK